MGDTNLVVGRRDILAGLGTAAIGSALTIPAQGKVSDGLVVRSPDGRIRLELHLARPELPPRWSASFEGRTVLREGSLALRLQDGSLLGPNASLTGQSRASHRGVWTPPYGTAARYDESYEELTALFRDARRQVSFAVIIRVHDHGFALRYRIETAAKAVIRLSAEETEFALPQGSKVWSSRDEGEYLKSSALRMDPVPDPPLTRSSDAGPMADLPLTVLTPDGLALSLAEADRFDYPRLAFRPGPAADCILSHLMRFPGRATGWSGPGDTPPEMSFDVAVPFSTPWRVVAVARSQVELIDRAGLPALFAAPNRLGNTDWIRPGKAVRVRVPYTTVRALACVEFARRRKLSYVLFDAHWYGDGTDPSDASVPVVGLDIERVIREARAAGVGTLLYVDRVPAMRQLPQLLSTYRRWGAAGMKFGFMWEGRQSDVRFVDRLVEKCGRAGFVVSLHDDLRPAGLERTWPNYLSLEGVRGNEHFPTARHNVTLPFTRCIAGPIDYTICYALDRNQTTNAHQLAAAVVYYSPLTLLYWYDEPDKFATGNWDALEWFDACPTTWDETRALSGAIGEHVAIARRSGSRWFVGAMTNEDGRKLRLPLAFVKAGHWTARIFSDGEPAEQPWRTPVMISERRVDSNDVLELTLAASGGAAIILTPA